MLRRYYKSHERADVDLCKEKDGTGRDPVQQIFPVFTGDSGRTSGRAQRACTKKTDRDLQETRPTPRQKQLFIPGICIAPVQKFMRLPEKDRVMTWETVSVI